MRNRLSALVPGALAALIVSAVSLAIGRAEELGFGRAIIEPLVAAILVGMVVRTIRGERPAEEPGVRFVATSFTPTENRYTGKSCSGVNIVLLERNALDAPELGVELAVALRKLYPEQFQTEKLIDLVMNQETNDAILRGEDPRRISQDWREALEKFKATRQKYLLYK